MTLVYKSMLELEITGGKLHVEWGLPGKIWETLWEGDPDDRRITICSGLGTKHVKSLEELANELRNHSFDIESEVTRNPAGWAEFISSFLLIAPPLNESNELRKNFYKGYGVDASQFRLSVDGGYLQWYGLKTPDPSGPAALLAVKCLIGTLAVSVMQTPLPRFNPGLV